MKKSFPRKTNFILIGILLSVLIIAYCQISAYRYNQKLKNAFVQKNEYNVYAKQEELTKNTLLSATPISRNLIEQAAEEITLDSTICYYKNPGDWIPKKIFWKGTTVMTCLGMAFVNDEKDVYREIRNTYEEIYGWNFYPSYKKGWRVAIPFIKKQDWSEGVKPDCELFYIRTSDVKKLGRAWLDRYGKALKKEGTKPEDWYLRTDKWLYEEGYYLSPDLYRSYFPVPVKVIFLGWIIVAGWSFLRYK